MLEYIKRFQDYKNEETPNFEQMTNVSSRRIGNHIASIAQTNQKLLKELHNDVDKTNAKEKIPLQVNTKIQLTSSGKTFIK